MYKSQPLLRKERRPGRKDDQEVTFPHTNRSEGPVTETVPFTVVDISESILSTSSIMSGLIKIRKLMTKFISVLVIEL